MAVEHSGPRMFVNLYNKAAVAVIDREKRIVIDTCPSLKKAAIMARWRLTKLTIGCLYMLGTPVKLLSWTRIPGRSLPLYRQGAWSMTRFTMRN